MMTFDRPCATGADGGRADGDQSRAEDQEADVPRGLAGARVHVMKVEELMIDDALDHVEHAPAQ